MIMRYCRSSGKGGAVIPALGAGPGGDDVRSAKQHGAAHRAGFAAPVVVRFSGLGLSPS